MKLQTLKPLVAMVRTSKASPLSQADRNSTRRGYNYRWQKARERHLRKEPWCRECEKQGVLNADRPHVDHIIPHRGDERLFWDESNWQTLCHQHHSEKTASGQ